MSTSAADASKNVVNVVGGKTTRACDSCITKRARWYCAADDAFLCQACDSSVHSANSLALRHERVRLKITSCKQSHTKENIINDVAPTWHKGFTKKARTPRHHGSIIINNTNTNNNNKQSINKNPFSLVPEVGYFDDSNSNEESEEQLLYRVPILDPFVSELCTTPNSSTVAVVEALDEVENETKGTKDKESEVCLGYKNYGVESLNGFLSLDTELEEFAADVESLLGKGLENDECIGMEELGMVDRKEELNSNTWEGSEKVKVEEEEKVDQIGREAFELCFDYDINDDDDDDDEEKVELDLMNGGELKENNEEKRDALLELDYEGVITAWESEKSPFVNGDKPDLEPLHQCWPHCTGTCGMELHHQPYGELGDLFKCHPAMADGERKARVSRYREKRRTRLFSKKIRYEVRKLNAEKRPRMKGRFVKRATFAASQTFPLLK
ncbi:hypothetical protein RIF29_16365 [Crotalaria pallida]|uniref:Uncharacterized protein n=1 Tax=Crotalaria pallida TaxID=3830 RepID=A0AAN9FGD0_CROPI